MNFIRQLATAIVFVFGFSLSSVGRNSLNHLKEFFKKRKFLIQLCFDCTHFAMFVPPLLLPFVTLWKTPLSSPRKNLAIV